MHCMFVYGWYFMQIKYLNLDSKLKCMYTVKIFTWLENISHIPVYYLFSCTLNLHKLIWYLLQTLPCALEYYSCVLFYYYYNFICVLLTINK